MNTSGSAGLISGMTSSFMNDVIGLFVGLDRVNVLGMFFLIWFFRDYFRFVYVERMNEQDGSESLTVQRWTSRIAKMAQPDLDFIGKSSNSLLFVVV